MSRIYINPGHGGTDTGAIGVGGRREKDDNLRYATDVARLLRAKGHEVRLERDGDYLINVADIAERANMWGADLFISFHRNAYNGTAQGAETLIVPEASSTSRQLAQAIVNALSDAGFKNRGVKVQSTNVYVLSHTTMPAVTIESGFIDNAADNAIFDENYDEIVTGIADAIDSIARGLTRSPLTPPAAPDTSVPELIRVLKYKTPLMRGNDVRLAQERLLLHLANPGKIDGVFGRNTEAAVKRFQQARIDEGRDAGVKYNGGRPDGKIGMMTWALLWE